MACTTASPSKDPLRHAGKCHHQPPCPVAIADQVENPLLTLWQI